MPINVGMANSRPMNMNVDKLPLCMLLICSDFFKAPMLMSGLILLSVKCIRRHSNAIIKKMILIVVKNVVSLREFSTVCCADGRSQ